MLIHPSGPIVLIHRHVEAEMRPGPGHGGPRAGGGAMHTSPVEEPYTTVKRPCTVLDSWSLGGASWLHLRWAPLPADCDTNREHRIGAEPDTEGARQGVDREWAGAAPGPRRMALPHRPAATAPMRVRHTGRGTEAGTGHLLKAYQTHLVGGAVCMVTHTSCGRGQRAW